MTRSPADARVVSFSSGRQRLDARLHAPEDPPRGAIVVAHPSPAHGGDMDHDVVRRAAEHACRHDLLALRFDFRGVGASEGDVGDRKGHVEDWGAACAFLRDLLGDGPLFGAGFSYGARMLTVALRPEAPAPPDLEGVLLLAPVTRIPRTRRDYGNLLLGRPLSDVTVDAAARSNLGSLSVPVEVIVGEADVVAPPADLEEYLPTHAHLEILPALNHFFVHGRGAHPLDADLLGPALDRALGRLLSA